jgi:hypothetical protein
MKSSESRELVYVVAWIAIIINLVALTTPVVMVVALLIGSGTYFRPMIQQPLGIGLLAFGLVVIAAGYAATYLAVRLLRAGRPIAVVLVVVATTFLCAFPALWVVLLGPALLILMTGQAA